MKKPTLLQLTYLVALADNGHFGCAADACNISQPGLSSQIMELESRLASALVERLPRGIRLTPEGVDVVARARRVLTDVDELTEAAHVMANAINGPLVVGAIPTVAPYLLGDFVSAIDGVHDRAMLRFEELPTRELLSALRSGSVDVAICALPVEGSELVSYPLLCDQFLLAMSSTSPLAESADPLPLAILSQLNVLLLDEGHCLRDQALDVCANARAQATDLRATSLPTLVQMVAAGVGVTLLPVTAASVEARAGNGIVVRPFIDPPFRTLSMVWRASSPRDRIYRSISLDFARRLGRFQSPDGVALPRPTTSTRRRHRAGLDELLPELD
jgi:LysR family hydrogen peroxide-inducible transcriptional activator